MQEKSLLSYWLILYKRKIGILLITVISVMTVIILGAVLPRVYEAKAVFYVPSASPSLSYLSTTTQGFARDRLVPTPKEDDAGPYIGILKSDTIAQYVHKEFPKKSVRKLKLLDVDFELTDEFLIKISSRDSDPVVAAGVANAYVKYFNQILQDASSKNPEMDKSLLNRQFAEAEKNLQSAKDELKRYEEANSIVSVSDEMKSLTDQRASFQSQLDNTIVLISENNEKTKSTTDQLAKEGKLISESEFILTNNAIETYQKKLAELTAQIAGATIDLKESHPDVRMLRNQYKDISESMRQEVQNLTKSQIKPVNTFYEQLRQNLINLVIEKNKLLATRKGYSEVIEKVNERLRRFPAIDTEWNRLKDNVDHYKKICEQLRVNMQEVAMQQERAIQYAVVVDTPEPPTSYSFPIMWLNIVISLMFGLSFGIFYALFMDYVDRTGSVRTLRIIKAVLSETKR